MLTFGAVGSLQLTWLLFADDTTLVADSEKLCRLVLEFERVYEKRKLCVNVGKSKIMRCLMSVKVNRISVFLNGMLLEEVQWFKNPSSYAEKIELVETEVMLQVKGFSVLDALDSLMSCRMLGGEARVRLYEGVVVPTVLH